MGNRLAKLSAGGGIAILAALPTVAGCESRSNAVAAAASVCTLPRESRAVEPAVPGRPDLSGHTRIGKASFYAQRFAHRLMANGQRMDPLGDNAASRTLPLGSTARVINLDTGQSATVRIADRGPYVRGRIVDLSPATARRIGITPQVGIARVRVIPISVRLPDGSLKPGTGASPPVCRSAAT